MNKEEFHSAAMPMLEAAVSDLQPRVDNVRLTAVGTSGSSIHLSAFFKAPQTETDLLFFTIGFRVIDEVEGMDAQVVWDHDSLYVEAEWPEDCCAPVTSENLQYLLAELPRLIAAFKAAVLRGRPGDE